MCHFTTSLVYIDSFTILYKLKPDLLGNPKHHHTCKE